MMRLGLRSAMGAPPPQGMSSPHVDGPAGDDCGGRALAVCGAAGFVRDVGASGGGAGFREKTGGVFGAAGVVLGCGGGAVSIV